MFSDLHQLIFVHIPKCAGMSVEAALGGLPGAQAHEQHLSGAQYRSYYPDKWAHFHAFTVVRHPLHRAWSYVRFIRRFDPVWRQHLRHVPTSRLLRDTLFSTNVLVQRPAHVMLTGEEELLRFESLAEDWARFAEPRGLPRTLPHRNRTEGPKEAPDALAPYLVAAFFPEDHTRFGYAFPEGEPTELSDLGTLRWAELHAWTRRLPGRFTQDDHEAAVAWLRDWRARLPLDAWRSALDRWTAARPPPFAAGRQMQKWAEALHDDANQALGKPLWEPWSA